MPSVSLRANRMRQAGFTLLEIMLVIVIMTVVTALAIPRFHALTGASIQDEASRLAQALRLASEEAQFTGTPVRWRAYAGHYRFDVWMGKAAGWQAMEGSAFGEHALPEGLQVAAITDLKTWNKPVLDTLNDTVPAGEEEVPVGELLLLPDGFSNMADIRIQSETDQEIAEVNVRPGPDGIRVAEQPS